MDETTNQETPEMEDGASKQVETHEPEPPREGGGGLLRGLIWLIILALIAWGGYTAYKNRNAEPETPSETATTTAETATGTPAQPAQ